MDRISRSRKNGSPPLRHERPLPSVAEVAKDVTRTARQRLRRIGQRPPHRAFEPGVEPLDNLIVIGASAGGLAAITIVLQSLPLDFPAPIVLILHQVPSSRFEWAKAIERLTQLPVVEVSEQVLLRRGVIYIPAEGKALTVRPGSILASVDAITPGAITTIDRTFASAGEAHGDRVIGVVMSGLLQDGTVGLRAVHDAGGLTIVQNPEGAAFPEMPLSAMRDLPVTFCLDLPDIGLALDLLVRRSGRLESGVAVSLRFLKKRIELLVRLKLQCKRNQEASDYITEELVALKEDLKSISGLLSTVTPDTAPKHPDRAKNKPPGRRHGV